MRVTVWGEGFLDLEALGDKPAPLKYTTYAAAARELYPNEVHGAIADGLRTYLGDDVDVRTSTLDDPDCGLGQELLDETDVLVWWSHVKQDLVSDDAVDRVAKRILADGMGMVTLHSASNSKIFMRLMGTPCRGGGWRQSDDWEAIWTVNPGHPIARKLPSVFVIPTEEVWSEPFDIPQPEELVFVSTWRGGEMFRSGCCFKRGKGRIFYFQPGHESHPTFFQPEIQQVIANGVEWAVSTPPAEITAEEQERRAVRRLEGLEEGWFRR